MRKYKIIKRLRVIISLIFVVAFAVFFLDFTSNIPREVVEGFAYTQFIPSLLKFLTVPVLMATGFIVMLLLTFLFGRIYCSTVCPLGILQDVVSYISRKLKKKKRKRWFKYHKGIHWLRYSLLGIAAVTLIFGLVTVVTILDPYSIFGRIFSDFLRPVVVVVNNGLAYVLQSMEYYGLYHVDLTPMRIGALVVPIGFAITVLVLAATRGRLYCNTICPVGTLLGVVSRFSIFKIRFNEEKCTKCGICVRECKAECMDVPNLLIDTTRCVSCFNCMAVCPFDAMELTPAMPGNISNAKAKLAKTGETNSSEMKDSQHTTTEDSGGQRRRFIAKAIGMMAGVPLLAKAQEKDVYHTATVKVTRKNPVSPPGSDSLAKFNDACTACHLCVSVCPTQVLQPSVNEYGLENIMQPRMDYITSYCNYECVECSEVCPTGAILPITLKEKKRVQMGKAEFIKDNCIVVTEETACGACAERCPTKAVYMVPYEKNTDLDIPELNNDICIGCGACEYACPVAPYKAIYVEGNPEHLQAKLPDVEEKEEEEDVDGFAF